MHILNQLGSARASELSQGGQLVAGEKEEVGSREESPKGSGVERAWG